MNFVKLERNTTVLHRTSILIPESVISVSPIPGKIRFFHSALTEIFAG